MLLIIVVLALLAGCGMATGGLRGLQQDLASLQQPTDAEVKAAIEADLAKRKVEMKASLESQLAELHELFLQPGVNDRVAVQNAKDTFSETKDQRAWKKLVDEYFIGRNKDAMEWLKNVPEPGFALAILDSGKFPVNDQKRAVSLTCDRRVLDVFLDLNSPTKVKPREVSTLKKSCVMFK